jgi:FdhD protein
MKPDGVIDASHVVDALAASPGLRACTVHDGGARSWQPAAAGIDVRGHGRSDWLAEEIPVALVFNGISHAVMMCSPLDLDDFALGFGLSEGLLASPAELLDCGVQDSAQGLAVQLTVTAACEWRLKERRRSMAGRTGCGLCGVDSLQQVKRELLQVPAVNVAPAAIQLALRALRQHQVLQQRSGATHAAALCNAHGEMLCVREDVGRHNALDKLIGAMQRQRLHDPQHFVCITSRASFEMVQKTAMAGIGAVVAVSAPTALAVDTAHECNLALAGFARGDAFVAYTYPERFGITA